MGRTLRVASYITLCCSLVITVRCAYAQEGNATQDISSASALGGLSTEYEPPLENNPYQGGYKSADQFHASPQADFSPLPEPVPEAEPAGTLDTNYEPEIIQKSFLSPPTTLGNENPYRNYGSLSDTQNSASSPGPGYSKESDLMGEKSAEYEPEHPYDNEK